MLILYCNIRRAKFSSIVLLPWLVGAAMKVIALSWIRSSLSSWSFDSNKNPVRRSPPPWHSSSFTSFSVKGVRSSANSLIELFSKMSAERLILWSASSTSIADAEVEASKALMPKSFNFLFFAYSLSMDIFLPKAAEASESEILSPSDIMSWAVGFIIWFPCRS